MYVLQMKFGLFPIVGSTVELKRGNIKLSGIPVTF